MKFSKLHGAMQRMVHKCDFLLAVRSMKTELCEEDQASFTGVKIWLHPPPHTPMHALLTI
jgi:hypothetical protein